VAAKKNPSRRFAAQNFYGPAQAFTIARGHGRKGRAMRARLAKRKIATQDDAACIGKSFSQGDQQFALAICPSKKSICTMKRARTTAIHI
jgi:hypothetical protein